MHLPVLTKIWQTHPLHGQTHLLKHWQSHTRVEAIVRRVMEGRQGACYCQSERQPWIWFNEIKKHQIKLSALETSSRVDIVFKGRGEERLWVIIWVKTWAMALSVHYNCEHFLPVIDWEPHHELGGRGSQLLKQKIILASALDRRGWNERGGFFLILSLPAVYLHRTLGCWFTLG